MFLLGSETGLRRRNVFFVDFGCDLVEGFFGKELRVGGGVGEGPWSDENPQIQGLGLLVDVSGKYTVSMQGARILALEDVRA